MQMSARRSLGARPKNHALAKNHPALETGQNAGPSYRFMHRHKTGANQLTVRGIGLAAQRHATEKRRHSNFRFVSGDARGDGLNLQARSQSAGRN